MVNIKLLDGWSIKSDRYEYKLVLTKRNREFIEGHFSNLESCVLACIEMQLRSSEATTIFSLLEELNTLKSEFSKALHPLKLEVRSISVPSSR